jgi:hypothetical protein
LRQKRVDEVEHHYEDIVYEDDYDQDYEALVLAGEEL